MNRLSLAVVLVLTLILSSCQPGKPEASPTEGNLVVYCAESVAPAVTEVANQFMNLYNKAHITVKSVPTRVAIYKLLNSETTLAVTSRYFNQDELSAMKKYKIKADSMTVAMDGVVIIVNERNPLKRINTSQLRDIYSGKTTIWGKLEKDFQGRIIPAIESENSGTVQFFGDRVLGNEKFVNVYPCSTMTHVYKFVRDNENAIGLISSNWLNSGQKLLPGKEPAPKALEIAEVDSSNLKYVDPNTFGSYYYPYQAHIYRHYYPLTRNIYFLSRDFEHGLGAGFFTFAASAPGQQILLNNGLVPATMPVRLVQLNSQPL
ncbi:MAG: substrate-binding domain-containing protein [Bacteroidetes bacterium]|nr:substrate-binding domain-containing protein [Bacteroidota bacterium]